MSDFVTLAENAVLVALVLAMVPATYRIWRGPSALERVQALDLTTNILVGVIIVLGLVLDSALIIDVGIGLAAFSFVGTLAITRFISEGRFF
jgi:multisubunit Na+/H+ antiporter MnhF subunit